jgi:hypothetical protein
MHIVYTDKCRYKIQEQKEVPVWYTSPFSALILRRKYFSCYFVIKQCYYFIKHILCAKSGSEICVPKLLG